MDLIKNILPQVVENLSQGKPEIYSRIHKLWSTVLQAKAAKHAKPVGFNKGILTINVDSPAWAFHLNCKRQEILADLQKEFHDLTSIKFRIGRIK
jgi:predicted nucleic acid-binding Zn ribbon protein